ncbi:site-specific DNA-methyltransferase [Candidatus Falkowbacteria bacterium]|jgi:site-specific DNA-methyltransferase (adenine-specific)|nr:site-specific DNA-methyltransferase [Candidatus Falkowbacteria bacterium]MBT5503479.1 site-specific DNA-methyltransferase [Candidatus Falkowbacteria bacterium]MBT6574072.1 site-specific DNA-methyltransferase [Candidatus Falkowbacteria bacterium]MBT7348230.1 site-specific DNA-methyltransferase [Candidatus Falkowbacteria bacterium]MBT7500209.1 site-specific DNA-methyltransferase [Candidatus Falkowbacteria bacterium]
MKSKRNKTISVTKEDEKNFPVFKIHNTQPPRPNLINKLFYGDCIKEMSKLPDSFVDLIVTDPPYTIRKDFGKGTVTTKEKEFITWCENWIEQCFRILKPNGSIYICINWEASTIIEAILKNHFIIRNRITWKRDKGRGAKKNWKNNMEDIWFATKGDDYTFNLEAVKVKKAVIAPYVDKKGKPKDWQEVDGKKFRMTHPSNIWTDLTVPFWSMPENTEHPTQKPEKLIERIILASSNKGELIFDPFMGSGTTAVVAKRLERNYLGFEIEKRFYILAQKRLKALNQLRESIGI